MLEKKVGSEIIYKGRILDLKIDTVILPNGRETSREVVVHPGAVAVVAIADDDRVLLVRQYRHPVGQVLLEVPAGKLEKGEDPLGCAQRELAEETGFGASQWEHLATFFTTPGFSDEIMYLYLARGLYDNRQTADDDEFIEIVEMPLGQAAEMVMAGDIHDGKTIAGLMMAWARDKRGN